MPIYDITIKATVNDILRIERHIAMIRQQPICRQFCSALASIEKIPTR